MSNRDCLTMEISDAQPSTTMHGHKKVKMELEKMTGTMSWNVTMDTLPMEIISYIMGFLHFSHRKEASLVCRSWYVASQHPRFQRKLTFRFTASTSSINLIQGLGMRPRCSLVISHLDNSSLSRSVLVGVGLHLGPRLESLALRGSNVKENDLLTLLPQLPNLRRLDLRGLKSVFRSGDFLSKEKQRQQVCVALAGLEELDLSGPFSISDHTFNRLMGCTPRLRRLSLAGCRIIHSTPDAPDSSTQLSSTQLSLRNLQRLLVEQASTMQGLDLSWTCITSDCLRSVVLVEGLHLTELCLRGCVELVADDVEFLCEHQPNLRSLDLSSCRMLNSRAVLRSVAQRLHGLTSFSMSRSVGNNDENPSENGLEDLVTLPELKSLDLSDCPGVTGVEMVKGLSGPQPRACLEVLNLKRCTCIRDMVVSSLSQLLSSSLRKLDLTFCYYLTDVSVRAIATYLHGLVVLRLGRCRKITDWGMLGMEEPTETVSRAGGSQDSPAWLQLPKGRWVKTRHKRRHTMWKFHPQKNSTEQEDKRKKKKPRLVTEEDLVSFREQDGAGSLLSLHALQELDLSECSKLTDSSITEVIQYPDLQSLSLSGLPEITDASVASVAFHCRSLTKLDLSNCPKVSDQGIATAMSYLTRLQHLNLAGCNDITDSSLSILAQHCPRLHTLDISVCKNISTTAVDHLKSQLPYLENIRSQG